MATPETRKRCPYCREWISAGARRCRYCREVLPDDEDEEERPARSAAIRRERPPPLPPRTAGRLKAAPVSGSKAHPSAATAL